MELKEYQITAFQKYFSTKKIKFSVENIFSLLVILSKKNIDQYLYQIIMQGKIDNLEENKF